MPISRVCALRSTGLIYYELSLHLICCAIRKYVISQRYFNSKHFQAKNDVDLNIEVLRNNNLKEFFSINSR